jgi:hypothetical protein
MGIRPMGIPLTAIAAAAAALASLVSSSDLAGSRHEALSSLIKIKAHRRAISDGLFL